MEVHYHPNLHKKKIYEYLIEFVLIFSAVTLGFFAENYREKIVLEEQTSKIIVQLHSELKKDLIDLNKTITIRRKNDSLNNLLYYIVSKNQIEKNKTILYCIQHRLLNSTGNFETNTLSIKELENTSLFKNIKSNGLQRLIEEYSSMVLRIDERKVRENNYLEKYGDDLRHSLFNEYPNQVVSIDTLDVLKGAILKDTTFKFNGINFQCPLTNLFVPSNIEIHKFYREEYLNKMMRLNNLRLSTTNSFISPAINSCTNLLKEIEKTYKIE